MSDERLERIKEAYAEAESEQPPEYGPCQSGTSCAAIIHVYLAGRLDALSEWKS